MTTTLYSSTYHTSWALLVGINQYEKAGKLSYACNDADSIHAALTTKLGFPSQQITVLKDAQATKSRIMDEFIDLHKKASHRDDRVLFFFAGHGCTVPGNRGPIGFLIPVDGDSSRLGTLIHWDDLTRYSELIQAKHILFIMDACYSGLALRRTVKPGVQRFISDLIQRPARQVITAGKADQTVADGGGPSGQNSLFTGYLLEGLNGAAANTEGVLSATSLMSYLCDRVGQDPKSKQTPHYGHIEGDGDFILLSPDQEHLKTEIALDYLVETQQEVPEADSINQPSVDLSRPSFALQRGYGDHRHANFGRNDLSAKLGEYRIDADRTVERAFSWLAVLIEPLGSQPISIDIARKVSGSRDFYTQGNEPHEKFVFPMEQRSTFDSLLMHSDSNGEGFWDRYLKIDETGNIEFADTRNVFVALRGLRIFYFVQIMGVTWQLLFLAKNLLQEAGYRSTIRLTFSIVGTRDSILADFSREEGQDRQKWRDPVADTLSMRHLGERNKCTDINLKMEHDIALNRLTYEESLKVIRSIAQRVELAYNHQEAPRCFSYNTDKFPWTQYARAQHW